MAETWIKDLTKDNVAIKENPWIFLLNTLAPHQCLLSRMYNP